MCGVSVTLAGKARVKRGARIEVGATDYTVTSSRNIGKSAISRDRKIWQNTPGRLEIITCLQRPGGGLSVDNVVITAQLTTSTGIPREPSLDKRGSRDVGEPGQ